MVLFHIGIPYLSLNKKDDRADANIFLLLKAN